MTFLEEIAQRIDKALDGDCGYGVGKHLAEQLSPLIAAHDAALIEKLADDEGLHSAVRNAMNERGPYAPTASKGAEDWLRARAAELREGTK